MDRSEKRRLRRLFAKDQTHGGILPDDCRIKPTGQDTYDRASRRLFREADVSTFWLNPKLVRLSHGPAGVTAEGFGDSEAEALIEAGSALEARLVFVRLEREVGYEARAT